MIGANWECGNNDGTRDKGTGYAGEQTSSGATPSTPTTNPICFFSFFCGEIAFAPVAGALLTGKPSSMKLYNYNNQKERKLCALPVNRPPPAILRAWRQLCCDIYVY